MSKQEQRLCEICTAPFYKKANCSQKNWLLRRFCSRICKNKSQKGKPVFVNRVKSESCAKKLPCRICGAPTRYHGTLKNKLYGKVHCDNSSCVETSRLIKNQRIGKAAESNYKSGKRKPATNAWAGVKPISREEGILTDFFISIGWTPQYKLNTGVHTNKLPRYFRLDFALPESRLYVEIDGSVHRLRKERDARRDLMLSELGWIGLRIASTLVNDNPEYVQSRITQWANSTKRPH